MFKSIRWKFVIIYFILVLIAMLIAGIFIIKEIDDLHVNEATRELSGVKELLMPDLEALDNLSEIEYREKSNEIIQNYIQVGFNIDEEVWIVDSKGFDIIATTSLRTSVKLDEDSYVNMIVSAITSKTIQERIQLNENNNRLVIQAYPIKHKREGENELTYTGVLLIQRNLSAIDDTVDNIRDVILKAILFSSLATMILGFIISKSISDPIKDITQKAVLMSKGNFDHYVEVKSNDEIGELSETFNFLTRRLKRSLMEISLEKTKVEAIVNHMTDGVVAVDNRHNIIHMNPKATELMHLKSDEYFESDFDKIIKPISEELSYRHITNSVEDWTGSELITIVDSIVKFNYAPYMNDRNEKAGIVYVLQDFTEAEKLDLMRRDFVANVSHELKTPLTSIKSYTETLLDGYVDDKETQNDFLKVIDSEADRMSRLVRDLLQLSNFDSDKAIFYKEYNDYIELMRNSIGKLMMSANKKNTTIKLTTTDDDIIGKFDLHRLEQVYINIISNAIKYTPENGAIDIQLIKRNGYAVTKIRDNGSGIPVDDLNHIFDRFYRVDKARTRNMGGTGLGLSIAKEIVNGHDGTIEISSEFGKGTSVIISIPIEEVM